MNTNRGHLSTSVAMDLYVSPHLDDVVLSCGGRLAAGRREGRSAVVASVFAAPTPRKLVTPFARSYHEMMRIGYDPFLRRREDCEALRLLGAQLVHLEYLDCIYRTHPDGLPLVTQEPDIFGFDDIEEQELVQSVTKDLHELMIRADARRVFLPLALGWHRDHVLTRCAAERALQRVGQGIRILYFEDVPYVLEAPGDLVDATRGMSRETFSLTEAELDVRLEAISRYGSQQDILWHDGNGLLPAIREHARRVGDGVPTERYWYRVEQQETGP